MHSKDKDGNTTIDLPITRLGNIEDTAEVKETPAEGDYIPIIDGADNGQMKKTPFSAVGGNNAEVKKAIDTANAAKETATQAKTTADAAAASASTASQNASAALSKAEQAKTAADNAASAAATATQTANAAATAAQSAQTAATAAQTAASEAKSAAPAPKSFSIAANSWTTLTTAKGDYKYSAAITATGITAADSADVRFGIDSIATCVAAEVAPAAETSANKITVYAKTKPTAAVSGVYTVQKGE